MATTDAKFVNHYDILGVPAEATARDIKKAYRTKAKELHPDRNLGKEEQAAKLFDAMKKSYEVLKNDEKRKAFDLKLRAKQNQAARFSRMNKTRQDLKTSLEQREKEADELLAKARMSAHVQKVALTPKQIAANKLAAMRRHNQTLVETANNALRKRVNEDVAEEPAVSPERPSFSTPATVKIKFKERHQYSEEVLRRKLSSAILGSGASLDVVKVLKKGKKALAIFDSMSGARALIASGLQSSLRLKFKILDQDADAPKSKRKRKRKDTSKSDGADTVIEPKRRPMPPKPAPKPAPQVDDLDANDIFRQLSALSQAARTEDTATTPTPTTASTALDESSSVRDIKRWLDVAGVAYQHCVEKSELLALYRAHAQS